MADSSDTMSDLLISALVSEDLYIDFHDWLDQQLDSLATIFLQKRGVLMPPRKKKTGQQRQRLKLPTSPSMPTSSVDQYITLWFGPPGVGKTTFVNNLFDRVLFISTDRGTRFLSTMRQEVNDYKSLIATLDALESGGAENYDAVCLDHIDDICDMLEQHVCDTLGIEALDELDWGKGWKAYRQSIQGLVQRLLRLDLAVSFIAHETSRDIEGGAIKITRIQPSMPKSAWKVIIPMCDIVGYCQMERIKQGTKRVEARVVKTTPSRNIYCKDRTNRHPTSGGSSEPLDGKKFRSSFARRTSKKVTKKARRR